MRPAKSSNPEHVRRDRREKIRRQRLASPPLKSAYPRLAQLQLKFVFADGSPRAPVAQTHILHPPAAAFFHFPCGFADCDGGFELAPVISELANAWTRESVRHFECHGVRARDRATGQHCGLKLECTIAMHFANDLAA